MQGFARASGDKGLIVGSLDALARICFLEKHWKSALGHGNEGLALVKPEDRRYVNLLSLMQACYTNLGVCSFFFCFFVSFFD